MCGLPGLCIQCRLPSRVCLQQRHVLWRYLDLHPAVRWSFGSGSSRSKHSKRLSESILGYLVFAVRGCREALLRFSKGPDANASGLFFGTPFFRCRRGRKVRMIWGQAPKSIEGLPQRQF